LLSHPDGRRAAIDVKASRAGAYRAPPSPLVVELIAQALQLQEITSFHFVTRRRFRPAGRAAVAGHTRVYLHEGVCPSARDRESIRLQEEQAIDYGRALLTAGRDGDPDFDRIVELLVADTVAAHRRVTPGRRSLLEVPLRFSYLFDETAPGVDADASSRLVAAWGRMSDVLVTRDRRFMAGFPLPPSDVELDRGHLVARQAGGDEAVGINLIPQDRRLNRGRGADGRRWPEASRRRRARDRGVRPHLYELYRAAVPPAPRQASEVRQQVGPTNVARPSSRRRLTAGLIRRR
jgi:hypothetical protein